MTAAAPDELRRFEVHVFEQTEYTGVVFAADENAAREAALKALAASGLDTVRDEATVYVPNPAHASSSKERGLLSRMHAVVARLRELYRTRDRLLAERHDLTAKMLATGNWNLSDLSLELGYERTLLAVEFNRRVKRARRKREEEKANPHDRQ